MASLPSDRTKLALAQSNQVPGIAAGAVQNKNALTEAYDTIDFLNQKVDALVGAATLSPYPPAQYNRLINGGFAVNQRVVSGTVTLAAGAYGHDRWKAGAAGCTYTFATVNNVTTITITAGSLIQVIEGISLYSGTHTLSWTGTSQGKIGAGVYSVSGVNSTIVGGTNLSIEFNVGTLSNVQFNFGSISLPFQPRSFAEEIALCLRYYERTGTGARGTFINGSNFLLDIIYKVEKRVAPTATLLTTTPSITINGAYASGAASALSGYMTNTTRGSGNSISGFTGQTVGASVSINQDNLVAFDAEL